MFPTSSPPSFPTIVPALCFSLLFLMCASVTSSQSDSESLRDAVRTLRGQVSALLERRQEDFNVLEESIRHSLDKNSEVAALKTQMEELRREIQKLKGGKKPSLNEQKNDHLTVQWMLTAISELRAEMAEMSANYNMSSEMQQRQELSSGLDLLRGDVASFRRDLEELRAEQQQTVVTLGQLKQDVESSLKNSQTASTAATEAKAQMNEMRAEVTSFAKSLAKLTRDVKVLKAFRPTEGEENEAKRPVNGLSPNDISSGEDKRFRHNRQLRRQMYNLEQSERRIQDRQNHLDRILRRLEKQIKLNGLEGKEGEKERRSFRDNEIMDERLVERVRKLEEADRATSKQIFNVSRQVSELGRLHLSVFQLLESVENLETKVDKNLPELQREISKMEFNMAQATSSLSLIKEEQENQKTLVKGLTENFRRLEERQDTDHGHLSSLQAQILNVTKWNWKNNNNGAREEEIQDSRLAALEEKLEEHLEEEPLVEMTATTVTPLAEALKNSHPVNKSSLPELIESLKTVQKEYDNILHQLPHDCGAVEGGNGIYAISPGEGPPLLVPCDMTSGPESWTVVQRRIDGSQEFNRKWKEYAVGFGTPSGEFWLGNEALHRLTAENCSSLRIDFTDIYGKSWVAEYESFYISEADDGYRIHVYGYSGNASDALEYQNKMQFSAVDSDRDISNTHCAQNYEGGWWFSHCQHANLNGRYNLGLTWFDGTRNEWIAVAFSEMKVRRRKNCGT